MNNNTPNANYATYEQDRVAKRKAQTVTADRPMEDLHIALSLARGNSPSIKRGARLDRIAFHVERAMRTLNENPPAMTFKELHERDKLREQVRNWHHRATKA